MSVLALPLVEQARERYARLMLAEQNVGDSLRALFAQTWLFGQTLYWIRDDPALKGKWSLFLDNNFPDLGGARNPKVRERQTPDDLSHSRRKRAQDAITFFLVNSPEDGPAPGHLNAPEVFTEESIRACVFHQAWEKDKEQLDGNEPVKRLPTGLTFVNDLVKFGHRVQHKLAPLPDLETMRTDFARAIPVIVDLVGLDYLIEQLEQLRAENPSART